jgi:hypothetical protein
MLEFFFLSFLAVAPLPDYWVERYFIVEGMLPNSTYELTGDYYKRANLQFGINTRIPDTDFCISYEGDLSIGGFDSFFWKDLHEIRSTYSQRISARVILGKGWEGYLAEDIVRGIHHTQANQKALTLGLRVIY